VLLRFLSFVFTLFILLADVTVYGVASLYEYGAVVVRFERRDEVSVLGVLVVTSFSSTVDPSPSSNEIRLAGLEKLSAGGAARAC
jgi:hypothetical protein